MKRFCVGLYLIVHAAVLYHQLARCVRETISLQFRVDAIEDREVSK